MHAKAPQNLIVLLACKQDTVIHAIVQGNDINRWQTLAACLEPQRTFVLSESQKALDHLQAVSCFTCLSSAWGKQQPQLMLMQPACSLTGEEQRMQSTVSMEATLSSLQVLLGLCSQGVTEL